MNYYDKKIMNKVFNILKNIKNKRDATSSIKGYDYQFYYFINLILLNIDNDNYSFIYEGNEDIDMYIDDKLYSIIQIKYHNSINNNINENLTDKGGLIKILSNFIEKYQKLQNISKIIYSITNEPLCILKTSPINYKKYIENNTNNIYELLEKKPNFDNFKLNHFCSLLKIEFIKNKTINILIEEISLLIEKSYLFTKLNNSIKIEYKKEYILSLLHKYIKTNIYNKYKKRLKIYELKKNINDDINNNYNEEYLINEIINMLNSSNSPILIERFVNICINDYNLINKYKLLKLKINDINLLQKIQNNIYDNSYKLYSNLLNDNTEKIIIYEKSKIGHNLANLLNKNKYTINFNLILKKYYEKKFINQIL